MTEFEVRRKRKMSANDMIDCLTEEECEELLKKLEEVENEEE